MLERIDEDVFFKAGDNSFEAFVDLEKAFQNKVNEEDLENIIINDLNIQLSLCNLYSNYLFYKKISNSQTPANSIYILNDIDEKLQIQSYSKIFSKMILTYLDDEIIHVSYADLGENLEAIINIFKKLLEGKKLNEDLIENFLRPVNKQMEYKNNEICYEYIADNKVLSRQKAKDDYIDIFLKAKINRGKDVYFTSYKNIRDLEKEISEKNFLGKVSKVYLRENLEGTIVCLRR